MTIKIAPHELRQLTGGGPDNIVVKSHADVAPEQRASFFREKLRAAEAEAKTRQYSQRTREMCCVLSVDECNALRRHLLGNKTKADDDMMRDVNAKLIKALEQII